MGELLKKRRLTFLLTKHAATRVYLSGFRGSEGWVLFGEEGRYLFVDSRYTQQAKKESPDFEIIEIDRPFKDFWREFSPKFKGARIGFESAHLTHKDLLDLRRSSKGSPRGFAPRGSTLIPTLGLVEKLRSVKDKVELDLIRKSVAIADKAFSKLLPLIKPGLTESEVAWELEKLMRDLGAERIAWHPLIVAAGANSSMPHYAAGKEKLKKKEMILLDFGCVVGGYHSDITRVVFLGKPTEEQKKVYQLVLDAQSRAKEKIGHKAKAVQVDKAAREVIENQNYPAYKHGLSHGIGLEVHELPRVSSVSKDILEEGNVISVEPGIYIPGWGGVRIEDLVLVTKEGVETLTQSPKEISEVTI